MGANLQEWEFFVTDRGATTAGSPPDIDDDTGVLFVLNVGTADSPTIYTDRHGTQLTETNGVAKLSFSRGHVSFWTERSVTNLDICWLGAKSCGFLPNAHFSRHELPVIRNGQPMTCVIPLQNTDAKNAETLIGVSLPDGVFVTNIWAQVTSAGQNVASSAFDFGIAASAAGGDANGFLAGAVTSGVYVGSKSKVGALSAHAISGLDQALTITPNSTTNSAFGALVYMDLNYTLAV